MENDLIRDPIEKEKKRLKICRKNNQNNFAMIIIIKLIKELRSAMEFFHHTWNPQKKRQIPVNIQFWLGVKDKTSSTRDETISIFHN